MQQEVINLGKLFVKDLKLERGNNTFPRWVSHYIAELIKKAELAKGDEKLRLQKECMDAILKLWKHRWTLPNGRRPLENFEPLLNLLQKINPEKEDPYFFPTIPHEYRQDEKPVVGSTRFWVDIAEEIDKVARIWLSDILKLAGEAALDGQDRNWLINSVKVPHNDDRIVIQYVTTDETLEEDEEMDKIAEKIDLDNKQRIKKHKYRLDLLQRFIKINEFLVDYHEKELDLLQKLDQVKRK